MSIYGAFGSTGGTSSNPFGENQQSASTPFGEYYDLLQGGGASGVPEGYTDTGQGYAQRVVQTRTGPITYRQGIPGGGGPSGGMQFQGAALGDYMNLVNANQMNYDNRADANNAFRDSIMGGADDIRASGEESRDLLFDYSQGLTQQGADFFAGQEQRIDEAIEGYEDLSAAQASSISAGLAAQNRNQRNQVDAAAKMGDPNAIAAAYQMEMDADVKQAQTMTQLASQFNQGMAGLRMQGAQTLNQAGSIQQGYDQMASGIYQAGVSIANASVAQAATYEAQGLGQYAQMVASNPFNPVAFLPTLMSFFQFSQTPGAEGFSGFSSDILFPGQQTAIT